MTFHRITTPDDPRLLPWLDLYQSAFPLTEQVQVSTILRTLQESATGASSATVLGLEDDGEFCGLAWYERAGETIAFLWYLAIVEARRGGGLGARAYRQLLEDLRGQGMRVLVFEIEHPDDLHADPDLALRRRGFYQRNGARCAHNVLYTQSVGWQPEVRMWLMAHALADDVTEEEMAKALWEVFSESAEVVESVEWL